MPPKAQRDAVPGGARKRPGGFPCPDCNFIAKHAMGLGRHRSTRHGAVSKRQQRRSVTTPASWMTREQAAARAGVHYNTIRQWERSGLVRVTKRPGIRGALVSVVDLNRVLADRSSGGTVIGGGADAEAVAALERRFAQLVEGLEQLLETVRGPSRPVPRSSGAGAAAAKSAKTTKKAGTSAKKKRAGSAKRGSAKRGSAKRKGATRKSARGKRR